MFVYILLIYTKIYQDLETQEELRIHWENMYYNEHKRYKVISIYEYYIYKHYYVYIIIIKNNSLTTNLLKTTKNKQKNSNKKMNS